MCINAEELALVVMEAGENGAAPEAGRLCAGRMLLFADRPLVLVTPSTDWTRPTPTGRAICFPPSPLTDTCISPSAPSGSLRKDARPRVARPGGRKGRRHLSGHIPPAGSSLGVRRVPGRSQLPQPRGPSSQAPPAEQQTPQERGCTGKKAPLPNTQQLDRRRLAVARVASLESDGPQR